MVSSSVGSTGISEADGHDGVRRARRKNSRIGAADLGSGRGAGSSRASGEAPAEASAGHGLRSGWAVTAAKAYSLPSARTPDDAARRAARRSARAAPRRRSVRPGRYRIRPGGGVGQVLLGDDPAGVVVRVPVADPVAERSPPRGSRSTAGGAGTTAAGVSSTAPAAAAIVRPHGVGLGRRGQVEGGVVQGVGRLGQTHELQGVGGGHRHPQRRRSRPGRRPPRRGSPCAGR